MTETKGRDPADELVGRGARYVELGFQDVEDLSVPDRDGGDDRPEYDLEDEELRKRVRERLQERQAERADHDEDQDDDVEPREPGAVDWPALWSEFGFGTKNANGAEHVHRPQLVAAIESSDQEIGRQASDVIDEAVREGALVPIEVAGDRGETLVAGYRLGRAL